MDKLLQWIEKNVKEGTDIEEAKKLVDGLPKLPESREEAEKLIKDNEYVQKELDSRISKSVDNAIDRFKENKLPDLIKEERDKLQKELNPEETPEQKELREIREELSKAKADKERREKEEELMTKAKDLGIDPMSAKVFAAFGDDADKVLTEFAEDFQGKVNSRLEEEIKKRFGNEPPKGKEDDTKKYMSRAEFNQLSPDARVEAAKAGIKLTDKEE